MSPTANFGVEAGCGVVTVVCVVVGVATTGIAAGVGIGSGSGKVLGLNPSLLKSSMISFMTAKGLVGADTTRLASGISNGICLYLNTAATIPVAVSVGAVIPPPAGPIPAITSATGSLI